jgi:YfiH family protein
MNPLEHCLLPDWPAPKNVRALQATRIGGVSAAPYASLNLGDHVGDAPLAVAKNRMKLEPLLPSEPVWLKQVHGTTVVDAAQASCQPVGDASISAHAGAVCVVMTADCLPVLLCDAGGTVVGAAHAGWRGLCDGVIEATIHAMNQPPQSLMAWLGPAIGPAAFEVGDEVRAAFVAQMPEAAGAFVATGTEGKYLADIYRLARLRLAALGITRIYGGDLCTYTDKERFFSYRRDGATGRMGTFIWLE